VVSFDWMSVLAKSRCSTITSKLCVSVVIISSIWQTMTTSPQVQKLLIYLKRGLKLWWFFWPFTCILYKWGLSLKGRWLWRAQRRSWCSSWWSQKRTSERAIAQWVYVHPLIRTANLVLHYVYSFLYIYLMLQEDNWSSTSLIKGKLDCRRGKVSTLVSQTRLLLCFLNKII